MPNRRRSPLSRVAALHLISLPPPPLPYSLSPPPLPPSPGDDLGGDVILRAHEQVRLRRLEATVEELSAAYKEFMAAVVAVLEARVWSSGEKTAATDAALEAFKQCWELFRVTCDHAEELVESIRQRIGSECLVDEATDSSSSSSASVTGPPPPQLAAPGIRPISAVCLEQMSKAVRWLVIELQQGAGGGPLAAAAGTGAGAGGKHGHGGIDARFPEDDAQKHPIVDFLVFRWRGDGEGGGGAVLGAGSMSASGAGGGSLVERSKSTSMMWPLSWISMFSGFRSLYTMPREV